MPLLESDCGYENMQFDYLTTAVEVFPMISSCISDKSCIPFGPGRIENHVEETIPTYTDPMLRAHFRMTRSSYEVLNYWVCKFVK